MNSHHIICQRKAPEASWPVEQRHWAFVTQTRRARDRSSWPLVAFAVLIVIVAIRGLGL